jgi:hypothetical protein
MRTWTQFGPKRFTSQLSTEQNQPNNQTLSRAQTNTLGEMSWHDGFGGGHNVGATFLASQSTAAFAVQNSGRPEIDELYEECTELATRSRALRAMHTMPPTRGFPGGPRPVTNIYAVTAYGQAALSAGQRSMMTASRRIHHATLCSRSGLRLTPTPRISSVIFDSLAKNNDRKLCDVSQSDARAGRAAAAPA